jgi:hypothetical protein
MLREGGASGTLRPIDSITDVSGILDRPPSRTMTIEYTFAFSRRDAPKLCMTLSLQGKEGAGNAGCTLHPRSRVLKCDRKRTRAYRYSRNTPAFPAQWSYGLCRALPGDEFVLPPSLANWRLIISVELTQPPRNLAPATGVGTTRFCRTHQRRSSCAPLFAHGEMPPCEHASRPTLSRPPHPIPRP